MSSDIACDSRERSPYRAPTASRALCLLMLSLLLWVLAGCSVVPPALTPQESARQSTLTMSPESAATFQVMGTRQWERGVVVLYTYLQPAQEQRPPMQIFGYTLVVPSGWGTWQAVGSGAGGSNAPPPAENLVHYSYGGGGGSQRGFFSIVSGYVLAPNVAAVEITFDNGQVLRDKTGDGLFAVVTTAKVAACELRVLDDQGQILRRIDTSSTASPSKEPGGPPASSCPKR